MLLASGRCPKARPSDLTARLYVLPYPLVRIGRWTWSIDCHSRSRVVRTLTSCNASRWSVQGARGRPRLPANWRDVLAFPSCISITSTGVRVGCRRRATSGESYYRNDWPLTNGLPTATTPVRTMCDSRELTPSLCSLLRDGSALYESSDGHSRITVAQCRPKGVLNEST
jgi:hypothetical protein